MFVLVGAFTEEIVSPIPSFVVLIPAGAAAQLQEFGWWYLVVLAFIAAAGHLLASIVLYTVADRAEDWLFGKGRRFFGVTHAQLESYGRRLSGTRRDYVVLFLLSAIPVLPTSLLSLSCGFIKVRLRVFATTVYFGSAVSSLCYLALGYAGIQAASGLRYFDRASQAVVVAVVLALVAWLVYFRHKRRGR